MTKNRNKFIGIKPYMAALVYETLEDKPEESRMMWQADSPSMYAEARIGVASPQEIESRMEQALSSKDAYFLRKWSKEKKGIRLSDLVATARKNKKKSGSMITEEAISGSAQSSQGTLVFRVKSRTTGVDKNTLKLWDVVLSNYEIEKGAADPNFSRSCQCPFTGKHINKKRLWADEDGNPEKEFLEDLIDKGMTTRKETGTKLHLACYHEAAAITAMHLQNNYGADMNIPGIEGKRIESAFDLAERWDLALEAFARRYKFKQSYAEIDSFLMSHDIVSPYFKEEIKKGNIRKEIIKGRRHFERKAGKLMKELHKKMLSHGYRYKGYAREFTGNKKYESTGIVYEKGDTSFHVVYNNKFWLPFIVEKNTSNITDRRKPAKYTGNPVRMVKNKNKRNEIDERTGRIAEIKMHMPSKDVLESVPGAKKDYGRYLSYFR